MGIIIKPKRGSKASISNYLENNPPANELLMATDTREIFLTDENGNARKFSDMAISSEEPTQSTNILWIDLFDNTIKIFDGTEWVASHDHDENYIQAPAQSGEDGQILSLEEGLPVWGDPPDAMESHTNEYHTEDYATDDGDYENLRARATTQEDVGLGNVDNMSASDIRTDENRPLVVETRENDPSDPAIGRVWIRSDL